MYLTPHLTNLADENNCIFAAIWCVFVHWKSLLAGKSVRCGGVCSGRLE